MDGKLPELSLTDEAPKKTREMPSLQSNPLMMVLLFVFSMFASIGLLFIDFEATGKSTTSRAEARENLERFYEVHSGISPAPYQVELRKAQQSYSRGDYQEERQHYRRVMNLLRAEGKDNFRGLTGNKEDDKELEEYLAILLSK